MMDVVPKGFSYEVSNINNYFLVSSCLSGNKLLFRKSAFYKKSDFNTNSKNRNQIVTKPKKDLNKLTSSLHQIMKKRENNEKIHPIVIDWNDFAFL